MNMNRRSFLASLAAAGVAQSTRFASPAAAQSIRLVTPASRPVPGIIDVGSIRQAFLDDYLIHEASRIKPFVTRPDKHDKNPIVVADKDWETQRNAQSYGSTGYQLKGVEITGQTVLYDADDRIFKMWYFGRPWLDGRTPLCLAISSDGYHWEKPNLGVYEFKGSRKNNIVGASTEREGNFYNVIKDPQESNPARRYKALGETEGPSGANTHGGVCIAFSPDGLQWTPYEGNPVVHHGRNLGDAPTMLGWDPRIKKYVGFFRPGHPLAPEIYGIGDHRHIRSYGYAISDDFVKWEPTELMLTPDYEDRDDCQYMQFTAGIDGQFYLGLNQMLHTHEETWDVYLMSSRDGFHWNWLDRKVPYIVRGEPGSYDAGYMTPSGPIIHDGKAWIYYGAFSGAHSFNRGKHGNDVTISIALCTLPENRWMGLLAGPYRATLVTRPVLFKGTKLMVDIEASLADQEPVAKPRFDECDFRAALEDQSGGRIEGFTIDRSTVLGKSGPQELSWGGSDLGKLAGKPVRLRFEYRNAALHSFQFV